MGLNELTSADVNADADADADGYLTETVLKRKRFDAQRLHPLQLLLVEEFQLVHGQVAVTVKIHTPVKCQSSSLILINPIQSKSS